MMGAEKSQRTPRKVTAKSLENAALHYLQRFATSAENLRRVLMRRVDRSARHHDTSRDGGRALVDELINRYAASGLLDDRVYAEARALGLHRRGASARRIRARLGEKGVGGGDIDAALEKLAESTSDSEFTAAASWARRRRFGPYRDAGTRESRRQRDLAALARAGFAYDIARRVIEAPSPRALEDEVAEFGV